ncbi:MAG: hypothetical protein ABEL04_07235 [Salinibacter sp.]|uniref:hypothetical protein n=1 Tax=Salinibacter sp. TaxID=2065818 RepID=UPI0035D4E48A
MSFKIFDVVLGLVGIYVFLSLICTAAKELIAQYFEKRAHTLLTGLRKLLDGKFDAENSWGAVEWVGGIEGKADLSALDDESLTKKLYDHPLVRGLAEGPRKPSYIPPEIFSTALLDVLDPTSDEESDESRTIESIRNGMRELSEDHPLRATLRSLLREAGEDLDQFRSALKTWYDHSMDRVASWYKKHTQRAVVAIAAIIAVGANADTLHMARQLSTNDALRQAAVQQSQRVAARGVPDTAASLGALADSTQKYIGTYRELGLPIGWQESAAFEEDGPEDPMAFWLSKVVGLLLTTIAISLGAPFWFDVLKKVSMIRSGGRSPREK